MGYKVEVLYSAEFIKTFACSYQYISLNVMNLASNGLFPILQDTPVYGAKTNMKASFYTICTA